MGIGVGGGVGPLRMGVSTHGAGVGIGPVNVGGSWGRGGAGLMTLLGPVIGVLILLLWPCVVGDWLAGWAGAASGSPLRAAVGWLFEVLYIVGIAWFLVRRWRGNRRVQIQAAELALQRAAEQAAQDAAEAARLAVQLELAMHDDITGVEAVQVTKGHRLLWTVKDAELIEPRSVGRGGPRVPTVEDRGTAVVTDRAVQFRSSSKRVERQFERMLDANPGKDFITFHVSNRQLVSGAGSTVSRSSTLILAIRWGMAVRGMGELPTVLADARENRLNAADSHALTFAKMTRGSDVA